MNPPAKAPTDSLPPSHHRVRERIIVPVPPDFSIQSSRTGIEEVGEEIASALPAMFCSDGEIVLENGAVLPVEFCVKCGRPASLGVSCFLRDRKQPRTWFGNRPRIEAGLCRKHREDHAIAVALTWSMLGVAGVLVVSGILTSNLVTLVLAGVVAAISGAFRAGSPFSAPVVTESRVVLSGAGEAFLRKLPVFPEPGEGGDPEISSAPLS